MGQKRFIDGRLWCVPQAYGNVLEIGFGTGENLAYYTPSNVSKLTALEPNIELLKHTLKTVPSSLHFELILGSAERIPFPDKSFDSVVCTWTLCSVHGVRNVLGEIYRVLKPGGKVFFIEHGKSNNRLLSVIQNIINPLWSQCSGKCNLNRSFFASFTEAGFTLVYAVQTNTEYRGVAIRD